MTARAAALTSEKGCGWRCRLCQAQRPPVAWEQAPCVMARGIEAADADRAGFTRIFARRLSGRSGGGGRGCFFTDGGGWMDNLRVQSRQTT